jgi:hypothetical protein
MKKKMRGRLDRIEQVLNDLVKEVKKLHPMPHRFTNTGPEAASPTRQTTKSNDKRTHKALSKKRTRTRK